MFNANASQSEGSHSPLFNIAGSPALNQEAETDDSDADSSDTDLAAVLTQLIRRWFFIYLFFVFTIL